MNRKAFKITTAILCLAMIMAACITPVYATDDIDSEQSVDMPLITESNPESETAETPEPEATLPPTETPKSEPTPTPTETPEPEPESEPTETPESEPTPTPTETPEPEPTPTPTETPEPEPTPTPAETPESKPTPIPNETPKQEQPIATNLGTLDFYDISIYLDDMYFAYSPTWNPDSHSYDSWVSADNNIRVENRSISENPISVTLKFVSLGDTEITAIFYPERGDNVVTDVNEISFVLPSGANSEMFVKMTLSGTLSGGAEPSHVGKLITDVVPLSGIGVTETAPMPVAVPLPLEEPKVEPEAENENENEIEAETEQEIDGTTDQETETEEKPTLEEPEPEELEPEDNSEFADEPTGEPDDDLILDVVLPEIDESRQEDESPMSAEQGEEG